MVLLPAILLCLIHSGGRSRQEVSGRRADADGHPIEGAALKLVARNEKKNGLAEKEIEAGKTDRNGALAIGIGAEKPETGLRSAVAEDGL